MKAVSGEGVPSNEIAATSENIPTKATKRPDLASPSQETGLTHTVHVLFDQSLISSIFFGVYPRMFPHTEIFVANGSQIEN